jgi:uncharacterized tellurite resistance protein B-like protein
MIDLVKKFFGKCQRAGDRAEQEARDPRVAACALFLEMALVDGEFTDSEREDIISILKVDYQLSDEYAQEIMEAAKKEIEGSIDLWRFTSLINQNYTIEEKLSVIEMIWKIAYSDGKLDKHEDYLVHKLSDLLRLDHKQLIHAKLNVTRSLHKSRT